jgi:hypothetical protein
MEAVDILKAKISSFNCLLTLPVIFENIKIKIRSERVRQRENERERERRIIEISNSRLEIDFCSSSE